MGTPLVRRCSREGCSEPRADVGMLCPAHRSADPPRAYSRYQGGPLRHCPRCDRDLPVDAFPKDDAGAPKSTCRECRNATNRKYKARHHAELLAQRRAGYPAIRNSVYEARRRMSLTP